MSPSHAASGTTITSAAPGIVSVDVDVAGVKADWARARMLVAFDAALGAAVTSVFVTDGPVATVQMNVQFLRSEVVGPTVSVVARATSADDSVGTATGEAFDGSGGLLATMSTRCVRVPKPSAPTSSARTRRLESMNSDGGALRELLDIRLGPNDADRVTSTATAAAGLANMAGAVQGGVLAALAAVNLDFLWRKSTAHGYGIDIDYVRTVRADGAPMTTVVEATHSGRSLQLASVRILDSEGRTATLVRANRVAATPR